MRHERRMRRPMRNGPCYVVDASVAAKWHLNDEELQAPAHALLIDYQDGRTRLIAPDIFVMNLPIPSELLCEGTGSQVISRWRRLISFSPYIFPCRQPMCYYAVP